MFDRRGADLRISIRVTDTETISELWLVGEPKSLETHGELRQAGLPEHRKTLEDDLELMKSQLAEQLDQGENWASIDKSFGILRQRANLLFLDLFGRERPAEVQALISKAFAPARASRRLALVEVISSDFDTVPLEFLRMYTGPHPTKIKDEESLLAIAQEFIGFSAIVKRTIRGVSTFEKHVPVLRNKPRLPVKFFWDSGLNGAQWEKEFFERHIELFDVDGPWPDHMFDGQGADRTVSEHLWDPRMKFDGRARDCPDQIQHFACHFYVADISDKSFFRLGFGGSTARVTLADIDSNLLDLALEKPRTQEAKLPLVFANACASSVIRPNGRTSLPNLILRNKNIGYIGTETRIPDVTAQKFSEEFYRQLLRKERLGEAITKARLYLLTKYHNPLGLLYTFYADPDIEVENRCELRIGDANDRE